MELNHLEVVKQQGEFNSYLITKKAFSKGEVIAKIESNKFCEKAWYSVQIGKDIHIKVGEKLVYMNHSCNPSVIIDTETLEIKANNDLTEGDKITFFYPSTEWEMSQPFECWCGFKDCLKKIDGAKNLKVKELKEKFYFAKHILDLTFEK